MQYTPQQQLTRDDLAAYFETGYRKGMHQLVAQMYDVIQLDWTTEQIIEFVGRCEDAARAFRYEDFNGAGVHFVINYALSKRQDHSPNREEDRSEEHEIEALHEDDN